jgi:prophage regulatory protein
MSDGTFPKQVVLGGRAVGWIESEILEWIDERIQDRNKAISSLNQH